jgi:hypothetical protein
VKQTQIPADTNIKMTTSSRSRTVSISGTLTFFSCKLEREQHELGTDEHYATLNFLYKMKLTTQIMQQSSYFFDGMAVRVKRQEFSIKSIKSSTHHSFLVVHAHIIIVAMNRVCGHLRMHRG